MLRTHTHQPPRHTRTHPTRTTRHQHRPTHTPTTSTSTSTSQRRPHQPPTEHPRRPHRHLILNTRH
ncbi:hypothetical protein, partial [Kitasatospora sp. NPDC056531]|uniref:hypothetical protein n=1 Tax=Kitasatospora sp. NPDC056531 TaxID=3345856 RepID=UPI0036C45636